MKSILVDAFVIPPQSGSALPGITDGGLVQEKQWNLALKGVFIFGFAHFVVIRSPSACMDVRVGGVDATYLVGKRFVL